MGLFSKLKKKLKSEEDTELTGEGEQPEYVQLETEETEPKAKITVKPFVLEDFSDTNEILDALRKGHTIALVNIRPLKDKDLVELKRAINKLKKTCDAIEGDIAGFAEDWVVVTPNFVEIYRTKETAAIKED
ncbi:hypothetical protein DRJ17_00575 [Candidatus Woesearchaeota archaeon]|nr:MAG: hypothetical protein DRJ17_00575 [Candidatus Woesearchaeota archaeon]